MTSPLEALALLGANAANAKLAAHIMESTKSFGIITGLPSEGLTVDQRAALARIGAEAKGQALHEATGDRLTANHENDPDEGPPLKPDDGRSLGAVIDELVRNGGTAKEIQAACSAHPASEGRELVLGGNNARIAALRAVGVSPLTIFPALAAEPAEVLYGTSLALTDWLLGTEEPLSVLRAIGGSPKAVRSVAVNIDASKVGARHFLAFLPSGHGLAEGDEAVLLQIYSALVSDAAALRVFTTRFGHAPDGDWSRAALDKMWSTLSRLPDRQVEANLKFGGLSRGDGSDSDQVGGKYTPGTGVVTIKGDGTDTEKRYEDAQWQSKALLAKQLGVDATEIDRRVDAHRIETKQLKGVDVFRVKEVEGSKFTYTLLHEMGHAVDALLGSRTELAYGIGGWKVYSGGDFDGWANEMGGWQGAKVSPDDKGDVRGVFEQHLQSSNQISGPSGQLGDLAPSEHALKKNPGAFLPATASKGNAFRYTSPVERNGRMYLMNYYYGKFMSYDAKINNVLPLPYAGFAPEEFFAECYVEYYREESTPGGNLPMAIKAWFDENVNRIGHGPTKKP